MKRLISCFCALMMLVSAYAAQTSLNEQESIPVVIDNYNVTPNVADHAVFYSLIDADSTWEYNFYIYIEEGKHDLVWGKTYTLADMNPQYCYWMEDIQTGYSITEASITKTKGEGFSVNITAYVKDTEGREFHLSYSEEPVVLTGDTVRAVLEKPALVERNANGTWSIQSSNANIGGRIVYYSADESSCAGSFAGDEIYLAASHADVFTGEYEYDIPLFDRIYAKDATADVTENDSLIQAHTIMVGEDGVVYDLTMSFTKPTAQEHVTITSDSLLFNYSFFNMWGVVEATAADSAYKAILDFSPAGIDEQMVGAYVIGENECKGFIVDLGANKDSEIYSGGFTISHNDGSYLIEGVVLCKNNVEYTLHLSIGKPTPTREDTVVFELIELKVPDTGWEMYGSSADGTQFISLISRRTTIPGTYTAEDMVEEMTFVVTDIAPDASTNKYYLLYEADLTATFDAAAGIAHVTGTMLCINTENRNDRPLFHIDVTGIIQGPFYFDEKDSDFIVDFDDYFVNDMHIDEGTVLVEGHNEDGGFVVLQFWLPQGATQLLPGAYPLTTSGAPMTTLASIGLDANDYATYSIAGYANEYRQFTHIWFLVSGNVTVSENGDIQLEALNSNGKTVRCKLSGSTQDIEQVEYQDADTRKTLRDGLLLIEKNQKTYNVQGIQIK